MKTWRTELRAYGEKLGEVRLRRGIFLGDSLSPLIFVLSMIPLTLVLRKIRIGYEWGKKQFRFKKCGCVILKKGKVVAIKGIVLPNRLIMRQIEEDGYKYLGMLETDKIEENKMNVKFEKEYLKRFKLVLKSKLNGKNKIVAINTWAISVLRYVAWLINWNMEEVQRLDRKTRKIMTMYGALHVKSNVDRIYVPREKGGRGLISCENCIRN